MLLQFIISFVAIYAFSYLMTVPKAELFFCGLTGSIGWIIYLITFEQGAGTAFSNVLATFSLTVVARIFSAIRRNPATVYLRPGIFPLVPGAGIYYTAYYLITKDASQTVTYGTQTLIVAGSIVIGILVGSALPQVWFNKLQRKH